MTGSPRPSHLHRPIPWPSHRRPVDPFSGVDRDSLMVFVPAIMSVGVLFSIASLVRDAIGRTTRRTRDRRIALETVSTVNDLLDRSVSAPTELGLLSRSSYVVAATAASVTAVAIPAAAIPLYAGSADGGGWGWLLALGLSVTVAVVLIGAACAAVAYRWPDAPSWTMPVLRGLPLTHHPTRRSHRPRRLLTDSVVLGVIGIAVMTWQAKKHSGVFEWIDEPVRSAIAGMDWIEHLETIDVLGSTVISIGSVVVIGMSGFRCRVMALVYPAALVVSWLATALLQELVERTRPTGFGEIESFPSGHIVQAVFIAGLLPTALAVLFRMRPRAVLAVRVVLAALVVATAMIRIHREDHWPTDIIAGTVLGITVVAGAQWVVAHRWWHQRCSSCPWSAHPDLAPWGRALYDLSPQRAAWLGRAGVGAAVAASGLLFVATATVGLPSRQADDGLGPEISEPAQLGLAVAVGLAGLAAVRWRAVAAFVIAICAGSLGLLASIEYQPPVAFGLTLGLILPAVLIWLGWQHHATVGAIFALAVLTATTLTATALGSREIYNHYFGPTHPGSAAVELESDADWLWLGSVTETHAVVVAGGLDRLAPVTLTHWNESDVATEVTGTADRDGVVRFELEGLAPGSEYRYAVRLRGHSAEATQPDRSFHTFSDGPQSLLVIAGSCARTGSNGAVFDRILEARPDLFLALGDIHYASLESTDPTDHLAQYATALSQPGPAAVYGSIPTVYVWDDHDFGPNDADSTSPTRHAVSTAYRQAVPNYGVDPNPDASIAQAFTVGRVRFVLTDTRSQRTDETMLGPAQLDWLIEELVTSSRTHAVVVWANPTPWISTADTAGDDWSGHPDERRLIADAIAAAGVENLVMVSGDAHMVAIDDGSNSGYASDGSPGFPVLHAAALDRPGSLKGGPYSHGAIAGSGQYGRLQIDDDGGTIVRVRLSGHRWDGDELLVYEFEVPVGSLAVMEMAR